MICGGGTDAEQNFSEKERTQSQKKMRLRPSLTRTPSPTTPAIRLSRNPVETEEIHPDMANGACVMTAAGHKPDRKP